MKKEIKMMAALLAMVLSVTMITACSADHGEEEEVFSADTYVGSDDIGDEEEDPIGGKDEQVSNPENNEIKTPEKENNSTVDKENKKENSASDTDDKDASDKPKQETDDTKKEEILPDDAGSDENANPATDFKYHILDNNTVTISKYFGKATDVVIPSRIEGYPVVAIYDGFMNSAVESVVIPDSVETIGMAAFANSKQLHTVEMGNGVTKIMPEAFRDCTALKNLKLSSSLEKIQAGAFAGCTSLEKVFIPKTVKDWSTDLFYKCPLTSLTFEEGIESVGNYACFWGGNTLKSVTIPASVKKLGEYAFDEGPEEVYFEGDAPLEIGQKPFMGSPTIYYNKNASGWDQTPLAEDYTLKAQ